MRRILVAFATVFMLSANAAVPFPGSTVFIKPVATEANPAPDISNKVIRLPANAGIAVNVQTTCSKAASVG